jgi:hypothetical protein
MGIKELFKVMIFLMEKTYGFLIYLNFVNIKKDVNCNLLKIIKIYIFHIIVILMINFN